jgi:hypothetical protein
MRMGIPLSQAQTAEALSQASARPREPTLGQERALRPHLHSLRRVPHIDSALTPFDAVVNIATSMHMDRDDFEFSPLVEKGGLGKAW